MSITRTTGFAFAFAFASSVAAQNIVVKNDSLPDDLSTADSFGIQIYFAADEDAQVWLTSPICGTIVAVELLWGSLFANPEPFFIEAELGFFEPDVFPARSNTYLQQSGIDAKIESPGLIGSQTTGTVTANLFEFLIPSGLPMAIPVDAGQTFVIALRFANTYTAQQTDPTIILDLDGCTAGANAAHLPSGVPCLDCDLCGLGFQSGDFVIRAIIQPNSVPEDTNCDGNVNVDDLITLLAGWGPNPGHVADFNDDGSVNVDDLIALLAAWGASP